MDNYQNLYNQLAEELKQTDDQLETDNIMLKGLTNTLDDSKSGLIAKKCDLQDRKRELDIVTNFKQLKKEKFIEILKFVAIAGGGLMGIAFALDLLVFPAVVASSAYAIVAFASTIELIKVYLEETKSYRDVNKRYTRNFLLADVESIKRSIDLSEEEIKNLTRCVSLYSKSVRKLEDKKKYLDEKMEEINIRRQQILEQIALGHEDAINQLYASDETVEVIKLERVKKEDE